MAGVRTETGEYLNCPVNQYGEPSKGKLFGLFADGRYWLTRALRWEVKRPKRPEPDLHADSSWLNRLKQLTQVRPVTEEENAALPDETAYAWERLSGEVHPPLGVLSNCTKAGKVEIDL